MKSDLIDIACEILRGPGRSATVTMPEWLAMEKGLI